MHRPPSNLGEMVINKRYVTELLSVKAQLIASQCFGDIFSIKSMFCVDIHFNLCFIVSGGHDTYSINLLIILKKNDKADKLGGGQAL